MLPAPILKRTATRYPMTGINSLKRVDLHLHTNASDGLLPAGEMVRLAAEKGMGLIAITDHDSIGGVSDALSESKQHGLTIISGIELSAGQGEEIHLLGYGFNPDSSELRVFLDGQLAHRQDRMLAILTRLRAMGIEIDPEEIRSRGTRFLGRMNLADAMVRHGVVQSTAEAFARYLDVGRPAYVPRVRVGVSEGIEVLCAMGAVVSLAHPGRLRMTLHSLRMVLPEWIEAGLCGLEAYHSSHSEAVCRQLDQLARRNGLLVTGGSDCHGRPGGAEIGGHLRYWQTMQSDAEALMNKIQFVQNGSED